MDSGNKRKLAGGTFVVGGLILFGKETLLWVWNKVLDAFSTGLPEGGVSVAALPWQHILASILTLSGLSLLFWPSGKKERANPYSELWIRADNVVARIRHQRNEGRWIRLAGGEPVTDVARDGISTLLLFAKQGLATPVFQTTSAERVAVGLEHYFSTMIPLLRDGHIETATACAAEVSKVAEGAAASFKLEKWSNDPYTGF
jgi:hypothetical protein